MINRKWVGITTLAVVIVLACSAQAGVVQRCLDLLSVKNIQNMRASQEKRREAIRKADAKAFMEALIRAHKTRKLQDYFSFYQSFHRWKKGKVDEWAHGANNNDGIPVLYTTESEEGNDTLGVIDALLTHTPGSKEFEEAHGKVKTWLHEYNNYYERLVNLVDKGFTAVYQISELYVLRHGDADAGLVGKWTKEDFANGKKQRVTLSEWSNGERTTDVHEFQSYGDFIGHFNKRIEDRDTIFAGGIVDELYRNSKIFTEMEEQARLFRRLELVRDELNKSGRNDLLDVHLSLRAEITKAIDNRSLSPREDAMRAVADKEFWQEFKELVFNSEKRSRRSREGAKFRLSATRMAKLAAKTLKAKSMHFLRHALTASIVVSGGAWAKLYFFHSGTTGESLAHFHHLFDDGARAIWGHTAEEEDCAAQGFGFSFTMCYLKLVDHYFSPEIYKGRFNHEYQLNSDEIKTKLAQFERRILILRYNLRNAEMAQLAQQSLTTNGYGSLGRYAVAEDLSRAIGDDDTIDEILAVIDGDLNDPAKVEMARLIKQKYGLDLMAVHQYLQSRMAEIAKEMEGTTRLSTVTKDGVRVFFTDQGPKKSQQP